MQRGAGSAPRQITRFARRAIEDARRAVREGAPCPTLDDVATRVATMARDALAARARPVINATGVVLHTNLGRAPLAEAAVQALGGVGRALHSVEIDLCTGRRGARAAFAESGLAQLAGAEAALVVNNNAAATMLALSAIATGRKVLVSRGELIEIGGGFRVPDVVRPIGRPARRGGHHQPHPPRRLRSGPLPPRRARRRRHPARAPGQLSPDGLRGAPPGERPRRPRARRAACSSSKTSAAARSSTSTPTG